MLYRCKPKQLMTLLDDDDVMTKGKSIFSIGQNDKFHFLYVCRCCNSPPRQWAFDCYTTISLIRIFISSFKVKSFCVRAPAPALPNEIYRCSFLRSKVLVLIRLLASICWQFQTEFSLDFLIYEIVCVAHCARMWYSGFYFFPPSFYACLGLFVRLPSLIYLVWRHWKCGHQWINEFVWMSFS